MNEIRNKAEFYTPYETGTQSQPITAGGGGYAYHDRTTCRPIVMAKQGFANTFAPSTLSLTMQNRLKKCADAPLLRIEDVSDVPPAKGEKAPDSLPGDQWKTWTYQQFYDESSTAARGFIKLGMNRFDAVTIYGFNHPVWTMSAIGSILGGGVCAGIYPTDTADQVKFKANHSGAVVAVVQNMQKMQMFLDIAEELPKLNAIVVWSPEDKDFSHQVMPVGQGDSAILDGCGGSAGGRTIRCMTWEHLLTLGAEETPEDTLEGRMAAQEPGHVCAYIYTSGTTGDPKAVMITHDNILFEAKNAIEAIDESRGGITAAPNGDRILSYLPLSHVAGMMVDIICAQVFDNPLTVYFARSYDLKIGTIGDRLRAVKPTVFLGVPRVWEKIQEKILAVSAANPTGCIMTCVKNSGKAKGLAHQRNCQMGGDGAYPCCFAIADKVSGVVASTLGLDECTFAFTGAAPIKVETLEFFGQLGININEVYGMSECTGATTWSSDEAHEWGSCGWPLKGEEVTIREVVEVDGVVQPGTEMENGQPGEVCFRGRHIMLGYMANPDLGEEHVQSIAKKNAATIDCEGWLHSGDKGVMDSRGMVKITGRYKELIIGAGGENVAPVPVEDGVKARCSAISNVMMVGDKQKFNVAFVTLKAVGATGDQPGGDELDPVAAQVDPEVSTISAAMDSQAMQKVVMDAIIATNRDPACVPMPPAKIQKFTILPADFSVATDELTPTFKLKRSVVEKKYAHMIEIMYSDENAANNYIKYSPGPLA